MTEHRGVVISMSLSRLLRYGAHLHNLAIRDDGFCILQHALLTDALRAKNATMYEVHVVVHTGPRQRYALAVANSL